MAKKGDPKKTHTIQTKIPVLIFEEGPKFVAYSPAIDLSTCGNTEEQARQRLIEAASIFFAEITRMDTVDDVLPECGWCKMPEKDTWIPPKYKSCTEEIVPISQ